MSANLKKLQDYKPSDYSITGVSLVFDIQDNKVTVSSDINFIKNNKIADDLCLDGEDLKIIQIKIDNQILEKGKYTYKDGTLQLPVRKSSFSVQTIIEIDPYGNTQLEGLYASKTGLFTQCEAEGFRKITFFLIGLTLWPSIKRKIIADKKSSLFYLRMEIYAQKGCLEMEDIGKHLMIPFRNRLICLRSSQQSLTIPKILLKPNQGKSQNSQFLLSLENST